MQVNLAGQLILLYTCYFSVYTTTLKYFLIKILKYLLQKQHAALSFHKHIYHQNVKLNTAKNTNYLNQR